MHLREDSNIKVKQIHYLSIIINFLAIHFGLWTEMMITWSSLCLYFFQPCSGAYLQRGKNWTQLMVNNGMWKILVHNATWLGIMLEQWHLGHNYFWTISLGSQGFVYYNTRLRTVRKQCHLCHNETCVTIIFEQLQTLVHNATWLGNWIEKWHMGHN